MKIGIFGAGAIGCYLGGRLLRGGVDVVMVGRLGDEIAKHGITVSDLDGRRATIRDVRYHADAGALADRDAVLVTVKSMATEEAGRALAQVLRPDAVVVSFQNGVSNADTLRTLLGSHTVLAGMVPFNVLREEGALFSQTTSGELAIEKSSTPVLETLKRSGLDITEHADMRRVLYSKLLFNLNNAINALSGVPIREQISDRTYRKIMSRVVREALRAMKAAGIKPVRLGRMLPGIAPYVLDLPDVLFMRVASAMVKVDPTARSSMWEDVERGRTTEIDYLNGEIVRLAEAHGMDAPLNRRIVALVREAEAKKKGSPGLGPDALLRALGG
jgi:2-dehydropantoate 2-reductase